MTKPRSFCEGPRTPRKFNEKFSSRRLPNPLVVSFFIKQSLTGKCVRRARISATTLPPITAGRTGAQWLAGREAPGWRSGTSPAAQTPSERPTPSSARISPIASTPSLSSTAISEEKKNEERSFPQIILFNELSLYGK